MNRIQILMISAVAAISLGAGLAAYGLEFTSTSSEFVAALSGAGPRGGHSGGGAGLSGVGPTQGGLRGSMGAPSQGAIRGHSVPFRTGSPGIGYARRGGLTNPNMLYRGNVNAWNRYNRWDGLYPYGYNGWNYGNYYPSYGYSYYDNDGYYDNPQYYAPYYAPTPVPYYNNNPWNYDQNVQYYPQQVQPNPSAPTQKTYPGTIQNNINIHPQRTQNPVNKQTPAKVQKSERPDIIVYPPAPSRTPSHVQDETPRMKPEDQVRSISLTIYVKGVSIPLEVQNDDIINGKVIEIISGAAGTIFIVACNPDNKPTKTPSGAAGEWVWHAPEDEQVCGYWLWQTYDAAGNNAEGHAKIHSAESSSYLPAGVSINVSGGLTGPVVVKLTDADGTITSMTVLKENLPSVMTLPLHSGSYVEVEIVSPEVGTPIEREATPNGRWQWIVPTQSSQGYWLWVPPVKV